MSEHNTGGSVDTDILQVKNHLLALKQIDFELAYLALLTYLDIKPLSRWEKPLADKELGRLRAMNLLVKQITRTVKSGEKIIENIFSHSQAYIRMYEQYFGNTEIKKNAQSQRFEGFLFGYPPCCIEQYIRKPYAPNNLEEKEQKILFHWACKNCGITPFILLCYKSVFEQIENLP